MSFKRTFYDIHKLLRNVISVIFVKRKTEYEMRIRVWSSDRSSSDLTAILLSSDTASTSLNLGATNDTAIADGFNLQTSGNGNIYAGTSMLIQVPGHLPMAAGASASLTSQQIKHLPTRRSIFTHPTNPSHTPSDPTTASRGKKN